MKPLIWTIDMIYFLGVILVLILLYLLSIRGRVGFTDFKNFKNTRFAHRGLHGDGVPENSLSAFKSAVENGYGAELDVHMTKDGKLVVIHDASLLRTVGIDLRVEDLTLSELSKFTLEGTEEKIPTLKEVLELFEGKQPLIIELKTVKNAHKLCFLTASMLKSYKGIYCIESFDPRCVLWFKKYSPETVRGQLSENHFKSKNSPLNSILKLVMTFILTNFLTKPDFVSYRFRDRNNLSFKICTKLYGVQGVTWTVRGDEIEKSESENLIPIFEKVKRQ